MKVERRAADILLREAGDSFKMRWGWVPLRLKIRPVTTKTLIRISREVSQITELKTGDDDDAFQVTLANADNLRHISRAIAYAAEARFVRLTAEAVRSLPLKHLKTLWMAVIRQSDPSSFFFIMISARGMDKISRAEER